jgi:hypothetical protein
MSPLVTLRRGYSHHGIYVGDGKVVHYAGLCSAWHRGPVEEVLLEHFAQVARCQSSRARYSAAEVVERARSRLGENHYRLTRNDCEHFCEWCICGESRSEQLRKLWAYVRNRTDSRQFPLDTLLSLQ